MRKEPKQEETSGNFWLYAILKLGAMVFLMIFSLVLIVLKNGLRGVRLKKASKTIERLNYKILSKILYYLKSQ